MVNITFVAKMMVSCTALVASLFLLCSSAGITPLQEVGGSLRGARRLQGLQYGANNPATQAGIQYGSQAAGHAVQYGTQAADHATQFGSQAAGHVGNAVGNVHEGVTSGLGYGGDALHSGWQYGRDQLHQGAQYGGQFAGQLKEHPYNTMSNGLKYNPQTVADRWLQSFLPFPPVFIYLAQFIFAVIYFCTVVHQYPYWNGPTPMSCQMQADPAPCATTNTSPSNCCLSYFCPQARAAHTFDRTGVMDYWCGVVAMFCCPFCTLCWANACTDLNPRLGGEPANIIASAVCTWCCSCCTIAQDAESLDACTGARTQVCGVQQGMNPHFDPYGGRMPNQAMMHQHGRY